MWGKKKVSIDFTNDAYQLLTKEANKTQQSNSKIVNALVGLFCLLSPEVASSVGVFCRSQYEETSKKLEALSGFEREEVRQKAEQYKRLSEFFGFKEVNGAPSSGASMRQIYLKEGFVTFPSDWIVLNDTMEAPENCMYAGCVESRNSETYGIPHFLFFSNVKYGADYTADMERRIYEACAETFPEFKKFYNMQLPIPDASGTFDERVAALKEWDRAPCFGLFHIAEKGDPLYWNEYTPNYQPPFGAMIVRSKGRHKREDIGND